MSPKPRYLLFVGCLLTTSPLQAQSVPLPAGAETLLKQLEVFEREKRSEAEEAIAEKRRLVAKALQPHQEKETKDGRLESAVWLKEKIAELTGDSTKPDAAALQGTTWKNGSWMYHFLDGGVVEVKAPSGQNRYRWVQEGQKVQITAADGTEFATWRVSRDGSAAEVTAGTGDGMEPKKVTAP